MKLSFEKSLTVHTPLDTRGQKTVGCLIAGLGALLLGLATFWALHTRATVAEMQPAQGTVIALEPENSSKQAPVVAFSANGQPYQFTEQSRSSPPAFDIGETVEVRYDPSNPSVARIGSPWQLYFGPGVIALIGLSFIGVCIQTWIRARRRS